ncbi:hypothetical protein EON62_04030, partial [archaeon]
APFPPAAAAAGAAPLPPPAPSLPPPPPPPAPVASSLSAIEAAAKASDGPVSEFGRFYMEPLAGSVAPGSSVFVSARFFAAGAQLHRASARVHISNFDYVSDNAGSLAYDLVGESCVPGINATDFASIFEEHGIVTSLSHIDTAPYIGAAAGTSAAASSDMVGLADVPAPQSIVAPGLTSQQQQQQQQPAAMYSRTRVGFAMADTTFSFGFVSPSQNPKGVTERVCLFNPTKVPAVVLCSVKGDDASGANPAFSVSPPSLDIPPHESRFVQIRFAPSAVRQYSATFVAEVDGGIVAETRKCEFHVVGNGSLPSVVVVSPTAATRDPVEGVLQVLFNRVLVGKTSTFPIVMRNDGVFPAIVKMEMAPSRTFRFASSVVAALGAADTNATLSALSGLSSAGGRTTSMTIAPGHQSSVEVQFAPGVDAVDGVEELPGFLGADDADGAVYAAEVRVAVSHNAFEQERVRLKGTVFQSDLVVEGLQQLLLPNPATPQPTSTP